MSSYRIVEHTEKHNDGNTNIYYYVERKISFIKIFKTWEPVGYYWPGCMDKSTFPTSMINVYSSFNPYFLKIKNAEKFVEDLKKYDQDKFKNVIPIKDYNEEIKWGELQVGKFVFGMFSYEELKEKILKDIERKYNNGISSVSKKIYKTY